MREDTYITGAVLVGRYRLERVIGQGGMGLVWAATDLKRDRVVAIKVILPSEMDDAAVARFERESRSASRLCGKNTVRVYEVGCLPNGAPYLVMELLVGGDLGIVLEATERLSAGSAVQCILQATRGVAEAHALGIVHRDIKPRNLYLTRDRAGTSCVKVLDFGLAKSIVREAASLTTSNAILGSPEYMSPEQLRSPRAVDARSDIWSLGVCLYELLTGRCPFTAPSVPELMARILYDNPDRADIPADLWRVLSRCLEKDPSHRYATARELVEALAPHASAEIDGSLTPVTFHDVSADDSKVTTTMTIGIERLPRRKSRGLLSVTLLLGAALATVLIIKAKPSYEVADAPRLSAAAAQVAAFVDERGAEISVHGATDEAPLAPPTSAPVRAEAPASSAGASAAKMAPAQPRSPSPGVPASSKPHSPVKSAPAAALPPPASKKPSAYY
jgi:serine/threonine-protein kinase